MRYLEVKNYDFDKPVSGNFKLGEFIQSETAYRNKLYVQYMYNPEIEDNIAFLADSLLQSIRDEIGHPIIITSGYRCSALNSLVGGAKNSNHLHGLAVDIQCKGRQLELAKIIQQHRFHECIIHNNYIHLSYKHMWNECRYNNLTSDIRFNFP